MKIEIVRIKDLKMLPENPKKHSRDHIEVLAKSIKQFGWKKPILISTDNFIIAGNGRVKAGKSLGLTEIPAIRDPCNGRDLKAYNIADNTTASDQYEEELLSRLLKEISLDEEFDLGALGFTDIELADRFLQMSIQEFETGEFDILIDKPFDRTRDPNQTTVILKAPNNILNEKVIKEIKAKYVVMGIEVSVD